MARVTSSQGVVPIATAPHRLPLLGHLVPLLRDRLGFLSSLPAHGDLVRIGIGPLTAVVVCDPDLTQQVLRHDRVFDKGGLLVDIGKEMMGEGLATCPYAGHRRLRRLVQPAFHPDRIAGYAPMMSRRITAMTESWCDGQVVDINAEMRTLTAAMTAEALFTRSIPEQVRDQLLDDIGAFVDGAIVQALMSRWLRRLPISGNRAHRRTIVGAHATLAEVIAERRAAGVDHGDLLAALLTARDSDGSRLSDAEVRDQVVTFFLAGTESTAAVLAWTLHLLDRHPDIAERLHTELDAVLAGRPARYEDLPQLPLTGRIITEALRLWPPVWLVTRVLREDTELGGHRLTAGTTILYSAYLIQRRGDLYPDPERFDPDRWDPATTTPPPRNAMVAFADGARKCIGDNFAITEATLTLASVAARWQLHSLPGDDIKPASSSGLQPKRLRMRATARGSVPSFPERVEQP
ncbi:cytochrome P450 [Nocardia sp. NPDC049149]|uniref:cytochrome P450 n=1 Tax=Nocardia sp. NPDC049149 TaxID=3364315 RepID=UPI0037130AB5